MSFTLEVGGYVVNMMASQFLVLLVPALTLAEVGGVGRSVVGGQHVHWRSVAVLQHSVVGDDVRVRALTGLWVSWSKM